MRLKNLLKQFLIAPLLLLAGMAGNAQLLTEGFEGGVPPAGWVNVHDATGVEPTAVWESAGPNTEGSDAGTLIVSPHSGVGMASFRSWDFGPTPGDAAYLGTPSINLQGAGPQKVTFWMYRDFANSYTALDSVSIYVNTAQNLTGAAFIGKIERPIIGDPLEAADGWYQYSFAIPARFNGTTNHILFRAVSDWGNDIFIDDITVENNTACAGIPVGGTASSSTSLICIGGTADLSLSGYTSDAGIAIQWESSPTATAFAPIVGATSAGYTATVTAPTYYRAKVTCTNSTSFSYSDTVFVDFQAALVNDDPCGAIVLTAGGPEYCGNTTCATDGFEDSLYCSTPNNTVWFKFTPAATDNYIITLKAQFGAWVDVSTALGTCPATLSELPPFNVCNSNVDATPAIIDSIVFSQGSMTAGTDYYIRIDGYGGDFGDYCISVQVAPVPPSCTTNTLPANAAVNVAGPVTLSWNAAPGADSYGIVIGTDNPPVAAGDTLGSTAGTIVSISGLLPNTTYYWYVIPFNAGGLATGCITNATSFTTGSGPINDPCSGAINLTVANSFCGSPALGTLVFADSTLGLPRASCQAGALPFDVWYRATVPASGNLTVQTSTVEEGVEDLVVEAYTGTCGGLALLDCNDDGNHDLGGLNTQSRLNLTGLTPNAVIYFRVMAYYDGSFTNVGPFAICAWDSSVVAPIAPAGVGCVNAVAVNIDSAYKYTWATFKDASGNVIAQVYPNGNILGNTSASFYVNNGPVRQSGGVYYLDRNVTITPATQPTGVVLTRAYFTGGELTALSTAVGGAGVTEADLNFTKTPQTCATSASVASGGTYYDQVQNGTYSTGYYASTIHDSYSTFYLHAGNTVLPVSLASFNAVRSGSVNKLNWTTTIEVNLDNFTVQRSTNGRDFTEIGKVSATGNSGSTVNYAFTDNNPVKALNYYRLMIVDRSGQVKYSDIRTVRNEGTADVSVTPNPVKSVAVLKVTSDVQDKATIVISDMGGKIVYRNNATIAVGTNTVPLEIAALSAGTYVVKVQLNKDFIVTKINKL
jgi:hypothetical protein